MNLIKLYWTFKLNNHRCKISQLNLNWKPKRNLSVSLIYQNSFNIASITNTRVSQWFKIALYTLKLWFTLFPYLNSKLLWGLFIQHLLIFEVLLKGKSSWQSKKREDPNQQNYKRKSRHYNWYHRNTKDHKKERKKERKKEKLLSRVQLFATPWTVAY